MSHTGRLAATAFSALAAIALAASPALGAVNVKTAPTATFSGASVTVSGGNFSGLGNTPAFGQVTVQGFAYYNCFNPGGNFVPGQNPVAAQSGTSPLVELQTTKNGRATIPPITATVTQPATPTAQAVGCGGNGGTAWVVVFDRLEATSAHVDVFQSGNLVYATDFTK